MLQDQLKSGEKKENKLAGFYKDNSSFAFHGSDILLAVKQKDSSAWSGRPYLEYRPNTGKARSDFQSLCGTAHPMNLHDRGRNSIRSENYEDTPRLLI